MYVARGAVVNKIREYSTNQLLRLDSLTPFQTGRLKISDLQLVKSELWDARAKWRNLGEALMVSASSVDCIGIQQRDSPDNCLREMLAEWLRGVGEPPRTWTSIIAALRTPSVDLGAIADDIEQKYCR